MTRDRMRRLRFLCAFGLPLFALPLRAETLLDPTGQKTFRVRGEVQGGYEHRDRDPHSGVYDQGADQGWTLGRSNLTFEKLIPEAGLLGRVRVLSMRAEELDTSATSRSNPYVLRAQQAWLAKQITPEVRIVGGLQESPMDYAMTRLTWDLDYVMLAPFDTLGLTGGRSMAGLSVQGNWDHFVNFNAAVANPEGETESRSAGSTGYDGLFRFSLVPTGRIGRFHFGFHIYYRWKNMFPQKQSECLEGKSDCQKSDNDAATILKSDPGTNRDRLYGTEFTFRLNTASDSGVGFSTGGYWIRDPGGRRRDVLHPEYGDQWTPLARGQAVFVYLRGVMFGAAVFYRRDVGSGNSFRLEATAVDTGIGGAYFKPDGTPRTRPAYADQSYFFRDVYGFEYRVSERWRVAFGVETRRLFDSTGEEKKTYIDPAGRERTVDEYRNQFTSGQGEGIAVYRTFTRQYFIRTSVEF